MSRPKRARSILPREAFLSHSSKDRKMAQRVAATLRNHGVPIWYSETNLVGAQQWHDEIGKALERCDWFLIILRLVSHHSVTAGNTVRMGEARTSLRTPHSSLQGSNPANVLPRMRSRQIVVDSR